MPAVPISYVRLIDDESLEIIDSYKLAPNEGVGSLVACTFGESPIEYYVAGVALVELEHDMPKAGRILVFQVVNKKLQLRAALKVGGAVHSLAPFKGGLLAGVDSTLLYLSFAVDRDEGKLTIESGYHSQVALLYIRTRGNFILAGDLMLSFSLYHFKVSGFQKSLELVASDDDPTWLTAAEMLDDDNFLGASFSCNLFMCQRNSEATDEEHAKRLLPAGAYHLGDMVNQFRFGTLAMQLQGGASGAAGVLGAAQTAGTGGDSSMDTRADNAAEATPSGNSILVRLGKWRAGVGHHHMERGIGIGLFSCWLIELCHSHVLRINKSKRKLMELYHSGVLRINKRKLMERWVFVVVVICLVVALISLSLFPVRSMALSTVALVSSSNLEHNSTLSFPR